jgi:hypothetical protein
MRTYILIFAVYIFLIKISIAQTFSEVAATYGLDDSRPNGSAAWIDFDNDGDLDIVTVPTDGNNFMALFRNDAEVFVDIADVVGLSSTYGRLSVRNDYFTNEYFNEVGSFGRSNFIDYDNDGDLDIYCPLQGSSGEPNKLYRNDLESGFVEMPNALGANDGGFSRQAIWADYDNDNDMDVFVANGRDQRNTLYRNDINTSGVFTDQTVDLGLVDFAYSEGACWGDYDNDGDLDLYVVNFSNNLLYRNDVNTINKFTEVSLDLGVSINDNSRHACWSDFDNDGYIDLYVVNVEGYPNRLYRNRISENNGFEETGEMADTQLGFSGSWGDFDTDGDLDFYLVGGNYGNTTINRLYKNNSQSNGNNWLNIKAFGSQSNYSAIGTTIEIKAGVLYQKKFVEGTTGYGSQNSLQVEFGLGDASVIDSIKVMWPSGSRQVLTDIDVNQFLTIEEIYLNADFSADTTCGEPPFAVSFTDLSSTIDPFTVSSWLWDFNNDGTIDSEIQNPEWTYQQDGSYMIAIV